VAPIAVIEAPSVLGLRPTGVEDLPGALIGAGLLERLRARHVGRVDPPPYNNVRDEATGFLNPRGIADYARALADCVNGVLERGQFPLVLGGDCSILLGSALALNRRGRFGLLFLDGHTDFYDARSNVNGEVASSELALATGRGPELLTTYDGRRPLIRDDDVVPFGFRDEDEARSYGSPFIPKTMFAMGLERTRRLGISTAVRESVAHASADGSRGFWIHFDADVLDDDIMPAVDYRLPGGLSWDEIETVLNAALNHPGATGMEITIFNPRLDHDGKILSAFLEVLISAFRGR
jgi:arginase